MMIRSLLLLLIVIVFSEGCVTATAEGDQGDLVQSVLFNAERMDEVDDRWIPHRSLQEKVHVLAEVREELGAFIGECDELEVES